ncbi:MAG: hypothetical protein WC508_04115 [Patescibacteria group bacterium]
MKVKINLFQLQSNFWLELNQLVFRASFITFTILFVLDFLLPGFVTNWFNPIWLLPIVLITALIQREK